MEVITPEKLRDLLRYDPETGMFTYREMRGHMMPGDVAGSVNKDGYVTVKVCRRVYLAHRLAWLYVTGAWPVKLIDHRNGIKTENRFDNLREADEFINQQNIRRAPRNKTSSPLLGARWRKDCLMWRSSIRINGRNKSLGMFETDADAHEFYLLAKAMCHPGYVG